MSQYGFRPIGGKSLVGIRSVPFNKEENTKEFFIAVVRPFVRYLGSLCNLLFGGFAQRYGGGHEFGQIGWARIAPPVEHFVSRGVPNLVIKLADRRFGICRTIYF